MRVPTKIIDRKKNLKKNYLLRLELGFILSLSIFIVIAKADLRPALKEEIKVATTQETFKIEDVIQTKQKPLAPPPPRPVVPVEVPNDEIFEEVLIEFDSELDLEEPIAIPPPPPATLEEEVEEEEEEEIFVVVEQRPKLIGGLAAFQKTLVYPELARMAGIEGRVVLQFVIDKEGNVINPEVIRGIGGGCDEEAIRAIKEAKFIPGKQRGRPVNVRFTMPVSFVLKKKTGN
ncbi:MAG: energy transducer TonB [Balneolaceae bacterium]|nr:energy transducer TonB [Balneolaceae bacterium]